MGARSVTTAPNISLVESEAIVPACKPPDPGRRTGSAPSWSWRIAIFAVGIALGLAIVGYFAIPAVLGVVVTPVVVKRHDIIQTVVASGQVQTASRVELGSQISGTISEVLVSQGDRVKAGATLIRLDDRDAAAAVAQNVADIKQARARLALISGLTLPAARQSLAQANATLRNIELSLDRVNQLAASGYATRASQDDIQRAHDIAQSQVGSARLTVSSLLPDGSETIFAQAQLEKAQAAWNAGRARLKLTRITAPVTGTVMSLTAEPGNIVQSGVVLAMLAPMIGKQLVIQIDERSFGLIRLGQLALGSADSYPDERFAAEVTSIDPQVDAQRGSVEVKLAVQDAPEYLKEDMTVSVDIEVIHRPAALVLPASAVRDVAGDKPHVLVVEDGRAIDRVVKLGAQGGGLVEVLSGVSEHDLVIAVADTAIVAGSRVRARSVASP